MSHAAAVTLRDATAADIPAITRIYGHHVRSGLAAFEDDPPSEAEMAQRFADVAARRLPWLVAAAADAAVRGFAYAMLYRLRSSYRYTLEDSIYVAPDALRRGIGRALLAELVLRCTAAGYRQMVAVIGDSANGPSIGLHQSLGFGRVGLLPAVGFKHGRWVDSVLMQRRLGPGDASPP